MGKRTERLTLFLTKGTEVLLYTLAVFIVCVILLFQIASSVLSDSPYYQNLLMRSLATNIRTELRATYADMGWSYFGPFVGLHEVHWKNPENSVFLRADNIRVMYNPLGHLFGTPTTQFEIIGGRVTGKSNQNTNNGITLPANLNLAGYFRDLSFVTEETGGIVFWVKDGAFSVNSGNIRLHTFATAYWQDRMTAKVHIDLSPGKGILADIETVEFRPGWQHMIQELNLPDETARHADTITGFTGTGKLWITENSQNKKIQIFTDIHIRQLLLQDDTEITNLTFQSRWDYHLPTKNWDLWLNDLQYSSGKHAHTMPATQIKKEGPMYLMKTKRANLEQLSDMANNFLSNPQQKGNLTALEPHGYLSDVEIRFDSDAPAHQRLQIRGWLDNVSVRPLKPSPGGFGISGYLSISGNSGTLAMDAQDSGIFISGIYPEPLVFSRIDGHLAWEWLPPNLLLLAGSFKDVRNKQQRASVELKLESVFGKHGYLELAVGVENASMPQTKSYIPWLLINPNTRAWLGDALVNGTVRQAGFLLKTDVRVPESSQNIFELGLNADNILFRYDNNFADLRANETILFMDRQYLDIIQQQGVTAEKEIRADFARTKMNTNTAVLSILGMGDLQGNFLASMMNQHIFKSPDGARGHPLKAEGDITGEWGFDYNIRDRQLKGLALNTTFDIQSLYHPEIKTAVENLNGTLGFSQSGGFVGSLHGEYDGSPLTGSFVTGKNKNFLRLNTAFNPENFVPAQLTNLFHGKTAVTIDAHTAAKGSWRFNRLGVGTDFKGIAIDLPAPLAKTEKERIPTHLEILRAANTEITSLTAKNIASVSLRRPAAKNGPELPKELRSVPLGLTADIRAPVNLTKWQKFLPWPEQQTLYPADSLNFVRGLYADYSYLDLRAHSVIIGNGVYRNLNLRQTMKDVFTFEAGGSRGTVTFKDGYLFVATDELHINGTSLNNGGSSVSLPDRVSFEGMPETRITMNSILLDGKKIGALVLNVSFAPDKMTAVSDSGDLLTLPADVKMNWQITTETESLLEAILKIEGDLSTDALGVIGAKQLSLSANLVWEGPNRHFSRWSQTAKGNIFLEIDEGEFKGTRSRLINNMLSLLNIGNLADRFRGDFRDLSAENIRFKDLIIRLGLANGTINTDPEWYARFSFGDMRMEGSYVIKSKEVDYLAVITPSIAQTLPISALLLGASSALPLLLSLQFSGGNDFINQFSSANYRVTGNITNPEVKLVRIGDLSGGGLSPDELSERALDIKSRLRDILP